MTTASATPDTSIPYRELIIKELRDEIHTFYRSGKRWDQQTLASPELVRPLLLDSFFVEYMSDVQLEALQDTERYLLEVLAELKEDEGSVTMGQMGELSTGYFNGFKNAREGGSYHG